MRIPVSIVPERTIGHVACLGGVLEVIGPGAKAAALVLAGKLDDKKPWGLKNITLIRIGSG
jgi:hypothetical protein